MLLRAVVCCTLEKRRSLGIILRENGFIQEECFCVHGSHEVMLVI